MRSVANGANRFKEGPGRARKRHMVFFEVAGARARGNSGSGHRCDESAVEATLTFLSRFPSYPRRTKCTDVSFDEMTTHDRFFKTLLRAFLPDFLAVVAPRVAEQLDLSRAIFLDKEFFGGTTGRRGEADLLVQVPLLRDAGRSVLIHVEIESRARKGMARRLWRYRNQILAVYEGQVLSVVLYLRGGRPGVRLEPMEEDTIGPEVGDLRYLAFGLSGCRAEDYLARPEPLTWALTALMRSGSLGRAEHKLACLRRIAEADLDEDRRLLLVNCVETYLQLSPRETAEIDALRAREENREVHAMEMTWADRLREEGWKSGRQEGREEGRRREREKALRALRPLLLELLGERFGPVPERVRSHVEEIESVERLTRLARLGLTAESLEEMGLG